MCFVQVFLDEINTSSCMGLLKEALVDRTFFGQVGVLPLADNSTLLCIEDVCMAASVSVH